MAIKISSEKLEQLKQDHQAAVLKLAAALKAAGFVVKQSTGSQLDWPVCQLMVTSATVDATEFTRHFRIFLESSKYSHVQTCAAITLLRAGFGSRPRTYTKIDDTTYGKLAILMKKEEAAAVLSLKNRVAYAHSKAVFEAQRAKELAGVVLPPGMSCEIADGNGPTAGKYYVRFNTSGMSIANSPLVAEQTKKLITVINEIMGTDKMYVIVAAIPGVESVPDRVEYWTAYGGWSARFDSCACLTLVEAEAQLPVVQAKLKDLAVVKIVPYADVAVIGKLEVV